MLSWVYTLYFVHPCYRLKMKYQGALCGGSDVLRQVADQNLEGEIDEIHVFI
jgi:hypothetical protein